MFSSDNHVFHLRDTTSCHRPLSLEAKRVSELSHNGCGRRGKTWQDVARRGKTWQDVARRGKTLCERFDIHDIHDIHDPSMTRWIPLTTCQNVTDQQLFNTRNVSSSEIWSFLQDTMPYHAIFICLHLSSSSSFFVSSREASSWRVPPLRLLVLPVVKLPAPSCQHLPIDALEATALSIPAVFTLAKWKTYRPTNHKIEKHTMVYNHVCWFLAACMIRSFFLNPWLYPNQVTLVTSFPYKTGPHHATLKMSTTCKGSVMTGLFSREWR